MTAALDDNNNLSSMLETNEDNLQQLLHPHDLEMIAPTSLSPSAVMEFKQCPQSYLFQYIYKQRQPTTTALAKGSMCHEALERIFDFEPRDRTRDNLHNLLRAAWSQKRLTDNYKFLFETPEGERDIDAEREWGQSALQLLDNYYQAEDPQQVMRPNPVQREIWVRADLTLDPSLGVTATGMNPPKTNNEVFHVRGIIDRLDMVRVPEGRGVALKIIDYKTGKAPVLKYSRPMNERIVEEAFYQLKIYALLLRERGGGKQLQNMITMDLRFLRLFYLTSESGPAQTLKYDLGETQEIRDQVLQEVHLDLAQVWTEIQGLVAQGDPKAFVGCDRSFCYCHKCRRRFVSGTVWEPKT